MIRNNFIFFSALLAFLPIWTQAQDPGISAGRIIRDINILSSDSMMGREAGTQGEYMAMHYIASEFKKAGLSPLFGDTSFFSSFTYYDGACAGHGTWMNINNQPLRLYLDFYPLSYSSSDTIDAETFYAGYGIEADSVGYNDYAGKKSFSGKIFIIRLSGPDKILRLENAQDYTAKKTKLEKAISKGAAGVIFICSDTAYGRPSADPSFYDEQFSVPVFFVNDESLLLSSSRPAFVSFGLNFMRSGMRTAWNVGGYINHNAPATVVIGAHYDHVGMGNIGSRGGSGAGNVHNGADDNASGTAGVMELARVLQNAPFRSNNYVFLAFSAEEKGLLGSAAYASEPVSRFSNINYMINLDMIGRLGKKNELLIFGTGTSPEFGKEINITAKSSDLRITKIKSGVGGSDHMSFYMHGIPSIFLHTGLHDDYHTPTDDAALINADGAAKITAFAYSLISNLNDNGKLRFRHTTAWQMIRGLRHFM